MGCADLRADFMAFQEGKAAAHPKVRKVLASQKWRESSA